MDSRKVALPMDLGPISFQLGHFFAEMDRYQDLGKNIETTLMFQLGHFFAEMDRYNYSAD